MRAAASKRKEKRKPKKGGTYVWDKILLGGGGFARKIVAAQGKKRVAFQGVG